MLKTLFLRPKMSFHQRCVQFSSLFVAAIVLVATIFLSDRAWSSEPSEIESGVPLDIVFVIDNSGSTGGILTSVRSKFWEIQNEISRLEPTPNYRLGIVCMGRPSFKKENNYVSIVSDLTSDIDMAAWPIFYNIAMPAPWKHFTRYELRW